MGEAADRPGNDVVRREIQALLAEVDAELAGLVRGESDFEERAERIKRRLTAPEFLNGVASRPDLPAPIVSVVLPTRDRAASIGDAIESVQAQSFTNWELIIVDDGSRDRTSDLVAAFLPDRRIRYVVQDASGHMNGEPDRRRLGPRPSHAMPAMGGEKDPVTCDELAVGCLTLDA